MAIDRLVADLSRLRIRYQTERELQEALAEALLEEGWPVEEEHVIAAGRVDLWCDGIAIEIKCKGSHGEVLRQVHRYASDPAVTGVILVTDKLQHARGYPATMAEKPVRVVCLLGGMR